MQRFCTSYYGLRPVNATFTGMHDYDDRLPDWSPTGLEIAASDMRALRQELAGLAGDTGSLAPEDPLALDLVLADAFLEVQLAELAGGHFQRGNPALWTGEAVFGIVSLMLRPFAPAEDRARAVERRLDRVPAFLAAASETMGRRRPVPASWVERALAECRAGKELVTSALPAWAAVNQVSDSQGGRLLQAGAGARAAFSRFAAWLRRRPGAGYDGSACGEEFFDLLLRRGHFETRPAADLLREARAGFEDAVQRLHLMASRTHAGSWPAVQRAVAERKPAGSHYRAAFERLWHECRTRAEEHGLLTWPEAAVRYVELPLWAQAIAPDLYFLNYRSPAPLDGPGVTDHLVPPLDANGVPPLDLGTIKLNHVVHHSAVGHHVQNLRAYQGSSHIGRIAAVDCASRIGMFAAGTMAEGWACYAQDLMEEAGFLEDLERVAQQYHRVRQLARAIVDIELHGGRMGHAEAVRFQVERVGMPESAAARLVTRTSMCPATACMYWLGTEALHRLRTQVRNAERTRFSQRRFHDRVLGFGAVPVNLVARVLLGGQGR
ncbi:MAG TPA: DUF885 family protein [Gemmatimonadales bacterium]|nr:DUF885 family protein [Gemmatimonadales bacterium]